MKQKFFLSITRNAETLNKQTQRKAEETLEFNFNKSRETFHFNPPFQIKDWMIGLTSSEVYNSIFNIMAENNKFEFYSGYLDDEFSYSQLEDNKTEMLGLSDISPQNLQHETFGIKIIENHRKPSREKSQTDGYSLLLRDYHQSPIRDFENYRRILTGLKEDEIQLILKQYNSKFITYKVFRGAYTFENVSDVLPRGFKSDFEIRGRVRPNYKHEKSDSIIIVSDNVSLVN